MRSLGLPQILRARLEQDFNSLDLQREAAEAYTKRPAHKGWKLIKTHYADGGLSGGTLERPALLLLENIRAHKIDMGVVYKVDRLTRSLADSPSWSSCLKPKACRSCPSPGNTTPRPRWTDLPSTFCCRLPNSSGRLPASASMTSSRPSAARACGWVEPSHSATTLKTAILSHAGRAEHHGRA